MGRSGNSCVFSFCFLNKFHIKKCTWIPGHFFLRIICQTHLSISIRHNSNVHDGSNLFIGGEELTGPKLTAIRTQRFIVQLKLYKWRTALCCPHRFFALLIHLKRNSSSSVISDNNSDCGVATIIVVGTVVVVLVVAAAAVVVEAIISPEAVVDITINYLCDTLIPTCTLM